MISLPHDLYAHLVISAQKFKKQSPQQNPAAQVSVKVNAQSPAQHPVTLKHSIDERLPAAQSLVASPVALRVAPKEKMDDKISRLIDDPKRREIQKALDELNAQFLQLRSRATAAQKIRIENKLSALKRLLQEKSYV